MGVKFASRVIEKTGTGIMTTIVWTGTREEMLDKSVEQAVGSSTDEGRLRSSRVYQEAPLIWCCERRYTADEDGERKEGPDTAYGKKSAQLNGSMLSMALENHANYRTCWNHYLAAAPGVTGVPGWWRTATDAVLSNADSQRYAWIKSLGEIPVDKDGRWHCLKDPLKPGAESYDLAVYSVTETARFRTAKAAGRMVANALNKINRPNENFGIRGGDWKCDNATVFYDGEDWFATLTWTLSGNAKGWDQEFYTEK